MIHRFGKNLQSNNKLIVCEDRTKNSSKGKVEFDCSSELFYRVNIDGDIEKKCGVKSRCDFMVIKSDETIELYIELKGQDVSTAVNQILNTIKEHGLKNAKKYSAIVTSNIPSKSTALDKAKKILNNTTKTIPFIKNKILKLKYSDQNIKKTN